MGDTRTVDVGEFERILFGFTSTLFRLERQPSYNVPEEAGQFAAWLRGAPEPPVELPGAREWFTFVRASVDAGRTVRRVRVQEDPPTDYQQWERWYGRWSAGAGEEIRYLSRREADALGLGDGADVDWWLVDDHLLLAMRFDSAGNRVGIELMWSPAALETARAWRDLTWTRAMTAEELAA